MAINTPISQQLGITNIGMAVARPTVEVESPPSPNGAWYRLSVSPDIGRVIMADPQRCQRELRMLRVGDLHRNRKGLLTEQTPLTTEEAYALFRWGAGLLCSAAPPTLTPGERQYVLAQVGHLDDIAVRRAMGDGNLMDGQKAFLAACTDGRYDQWKGELLRAYEYVCQHP